ncbi:hypothetical protein [Planctomycetes bacterium K23_9]|uniref:DUF2157 domain-containing protein n=1 Tax=Stieleria marina TaxID=1930275 RepID=A0A517NS85_9BACT|nr:hypothetical protein K239x_19500 [Planctomycetes bacterium K23_9]
MENSSPPLRAQIRSLGKCLYTENPFYLISCGFVMYGLQVVAASVGDQYSRASFLTGSLALYTLLMGLTAIVVIRCAKVWQDARTILLIIVIGQVAYSIAVDELCLSDRAKATAFLLAGLVGTVLTTESVFLFCRIRFAFWYRASFYALLTVFYASPALASQFRASDSELANWTPLLFSVAAAGALLLLIPAVHRGKSLAADNGTPWSWPLFPLSAFAMLAVLAAFRSHAIWISFGSLRGPIQFEPLLLMPLLLAVVALLMEDAIAKGKHQRVRSIVSLSPLLLVCGINRFAEAGLAQQHYSFDAGLQRWGGSGMTVALLIGLFFYFYAWLRGVQVALSLLTLGFFALAVVGREPDVLSEIHFQSWWMSVVACGIWFLRCRKRNATEWSWIGLAALASAPFVLAGQQRGQVPIAIGLAIASSVLILMFIGWRFDTVFAYKIRCWVASLIAVGGIAAVLHHCFVTQSDAMSPALLAAMVWLAIYGVAVRRMNWFFLAAGLGVAAVVTSTLLTRQTMEFTRVAHQHWQLKTGLLFFFVGVLVTSSKTIAFRRLRHRARMAKRRRGFVRGF